MKELSEIEKKVRRHVVYTYLLESCLKPLPGREDELIRLAPSRARKLVIMPEIEMMFDFDLRHVPGFYYDIHRDTVRELASLSGIADYPASDCPGGWMLNCPDEGILQPYFDSRGRISVLMHYRHAADMSPRPVTSERYDRGNLALLPLGTRPSLKGALAQ